MSRAAAPDSFCSLREAQRNPGFGVEFVIPSAATIPGMDEVDCVDDPHDSRDGGGRAAPGAAAESSCRELAVEESVQAIKKSRFLTA